MYRGGARVSVLLLGAFEMTDSALDFDASKHGLYACFPHPTSGAELRGLLLPPTPERQAREGRAPAPPFWVGGDPTAVEGYASNRRHALKRLAVQCGYLGAVTDTVARTMTVVRFQVVDVAQMTFAEFRTLQRRKDAAVLERAKTRQAQRTADRKARDKPGHRHHRHHRHDDSGSGTADSGSGGSSSSSSSSSPMVALGSVSNGGARSLTAPSAGGSALTMVGPPPGDAGFAGRSDGGGSAGAESEEETAHEAAALAEAEAIEDARLEWGLRGTTAPGRARQPVSLPMRPQHLSTDPQQQAGGFYA